MAESGLGGSRPLGFSVQDSRQRDGGFPAGAEAADREVAIAKELFPAAAPSDWASMPLWADPNSTPAPFTI